MIRGTTPTLILTVEKTDLTDYSLFITLKGKVSSKEFTWDSSDSNVELHSASAQDGSVIYLYLTQEDTLAFEKEKVEVQVRWITAEGIAGATDIAVTEVNQILKDGKIQYLEG